MASGQFFTTLHNWVWCRYHCPVSTYSWGFSNFRTKSYEPSPLLSAWLSLQRAFARTELWLLCRPVPPAPQGQLPPPHPHLCLSWGPPIYIETCQSVQKKHTTCPEQWCRWQCRKRWNTICHSNAGISMLSTRKCGHSWRLFAASMCLQHLTVLHLTNLIRSSDKSIGNHFGRDLRAPSNCRHW